MTLLIQQAPRYFDFPLFNWLACNEVSEDDDLGKKGTAKKGKKICYICGDINHSGNRCKKVLSLNYAFEVLFFLSSFIFIAFVDPFQHKLLVQVLVKLNLMS